MLFCENVCWQESWTEFSLIVQTYSLLHQFGHLSVSSQSIGVFNKTLQHNLRMLLFWWTKMWFHADLILQLAHMCALPVKMTFAQNWLLLDETGMTQRCHRSCFQQLTLQKLSMPRGPRKRARSAGGCAAVGLSRGEFVFMHIETDSFWECKFVPNGLIAMLTYLLTYLPLKRLSLARSKARSCDIAWVPFMGRKSIPQTFLWRRGTRW